MKLPLAVFLILMVGLGTSQAQTRIPESFADSVVRILTNTRQTEVLTLAAAFREYYNNAPGEISAKVRLQIGNLRDKRYKTKPDLIQYIRALLAGGKVMEGMRISNWLAVTDSVIAYELPNRTLRFLDFSRMFFEQSKLGNGKGFSWFARKDDFEFVYIKSENDLLPAREEQPTDSLQNLPSWWQSFYPPAVAGPTINFSSVDLQVQSVIDTIRIFNVKGFFALSDGVFIGSGGSFDWPGIEGAQFISTGLWSFDSSKPEFSMDMGRLTYTGMLASPVLGKLTYNTMARPTPSGPITPRFNSYESGIPLNRITYPGLSFSGGFSLTGTRPGNESVTNTRATLRLDTEADQRFKVRSQEFMFRDSIVTAKKSEVSLYYRGDSIYHPSVDFTFNLKRKAVYLNKSKGELKDAPFETTYFNVDFSADRLTWNLEKDSIDIYSSSDVAQDPVIIQSKEHFNQNDWRLLAGTGFGFHALMLTAQYAIDMGTNVFFVDDLAKRFNKPSDKIRAAVIFLSQKGMVDFDKSTGQVTVKPRAIHLALASKNKTDYDNLKIHASYDLAPDVSISLPQGKMFVRGVEDFRVSDSLNLRIKPDSTMLTIRRNRDMDFNGLITAGNFEIKGKHFDFRYDSFYITLNQIDSIRFLIEERNAKGQTYRRRLNNALVSSDSSSVGAGAKPADSKGTLYINLANNKSGKKQIPAYPRLDANTGGIFYFDRKEILNGIYGRSVFFLVPPFKLDSIGNSGNSTVSMPGSFISNGMFPVFKDSLTVMPDRSLGFTHKIPEKGYTLFNGAGKLKGQISLDNNGIVGSGVLQFYGAQLTSDKMRLMPDSVFIRSRSGKILPQNIDGASFPQATFPEYQLSWIPRRQHFFVKSVRDPFLFYDSTAILRGDLRISRDGVDGGGLLQTRGSELESEELKFAEKNFSANHAQFRIPTDDPTKPVLEAKDVRLKFDLEKNLAQISPEIEGDAALNFPFAQFRTSIPSATWDFSKQKVLMVKAPSVPLENSYFYTTREDLDSLSFMATEAEYDISERKLLVKGIPYIQIADARITPERGEVLILENARIDQLKNTTIVLDTLNGYHRLTNGVIDIVSRKEFKGYGTYQYINAVRDTFNIRLSDFRMEQVPDGSGKNPILQTVASGTIAEDDKVLLSPRIFYKGTMTMYARRPALELKGYISLDLKSVGNRQTWISHEQSGDDQEILIDYDKAFNEDGQKASAGIHYDREGELYVNFLTSKKSEEDEDFFVPAGMLFYDTATSEFKIEDRKKALGEKLSGKVLAYLEDKEEIKFEGPINFFRNNPDFIVESSAIGFGNLKTDEVKLNGLVTIDAAIPPSVLTALSESLLKAIKDENIPEAGADPTELLYKVANLVGEIPAREYEKRSLQTYSSLATLADLVKPIVLSTVDLRWSPKSKGFYSVGDIGLSNIGRTDINGSFEGFLEAKKNEDGGPVFHLFLKASPEAWYYFGYEDSRLMIQSSVGEINDQVFRRSNAARAKPGELVIIPGSEEETLEFIDRFRRDYLQIDTPYDFNGSRSASKKKEDKKKKADDDGF
ncbi:MAG: hypothetical protein ACO263_04175 [Cyclobacteriaceae bacterium]